jgi:hypothetical protein
MKGGESTRGTGRGGENQLKYEMELVAREYERRAPRRISANEEQQALLAIELYSVPWDFGKLAWNDIVMVMNTTQTAWCTKFVSLILLAVRSCFSSFNSPHLHTQFITSSLRRVAKPVIARNARSTRMTDAIP